MLDLLATGGGAIMLEFTVAQPEAIAIAIDSAIDGDILPFGMRLLAIAHEARVYGASI